MSSSSIIVLRPLRCDARHFITARRRVTLAYNSRATFSSCLRSSSSASSALLLRQLFAQRPPASCSYSHSSELHHIWHSSNGHASKADGLKHESLVPQGSELAVVLLGWLGADQRHLRRYAEWYTSRGIHAITFVLPMKDLLSIGAVLKAERHVEKLFGEITQWLSQESATRRSLFFHSFSNTGWFTYGELLENLIKREGTLLSRIEGCVIDSAPAAVLSPQVWASGFATAFLKKQSSSVDTGARPSMSEVCLLALLETFFALLLAVPALKERLLRVISVLSNKQPPCPQLYIYSSADRVIPASYVHSFMAQQKERGYQVSSCDMQLSPHVDHFRNYPARYSQQLDTFIKQCLSSKRMKQTADC